MIRQTFKFALRSFRKTALLNLLNIMGLSLGLTVIFLVALFVYQENSYEDDLSAKEQVFQISSISPVVGTIAFNSPNLTFLKDEIPEVEAITAFSSPNTTSITIKSREAISLKSMAVDESFLDVFDYNVQGGLKQNVLHGQNSAVITDKAALKLFGRLDVVGEIIEYKEKQFEIEAIIESPSFKTQLDFELLLPAKKHEFKPESWGQSYMVYARLISKSTQKQLDNRLAEVSFKYVYPSLKSSDLAFATSQEWRASPQYKGSFAESIAELRTDSTTKFNLMPKLDRAQLKTMILIGLAALLISTINFINLSTAKATVRFKESGLKLILGATRFQLIGQFLIEAFLLVSISALLALGIAEVVVQLGIGFVDSFIEYSILQSPVWVKGIVGFVLGLSLVAGVYPAIYLSSGRTMSLIRKGKGGSSISFFNAKGVRNGSTVVQFVCSISLIVTVLVMFQQINFLKVRDLGYVEEDVLTTSTLYPLSNPIDKTDKLETLKNELLRLPHIQEVGFTTRMPLDGVRYIPVPLKTSDSTKVDFVFMGADEGFLKLMEFKLVSGEFFNEAALRNSTDKAIQQVVINQTAATTLGFENPVGNLLNDRYEIVGVVDDFFFSDLRKKVEPIVITYSQPTINASLVIRSKNMTETMQLVDEVWSELSWSGWGSVSPKWHVLESKYRELIEVERQGFSLILCFAIVAIFISCIGLLGFAIFTVEQRMHEFGVRKVLGATLRDIAALFSKDVAKPILLAFVITIPVAIHFMQNWLNNFTYRINLSVGVFALSILIIAIIALGTILFQIFKAGRLNPVETLRNE